MITHLDAIRALVPADIPTFDTDLTDDDGNDPDPWPDRYVIFRAPTLAEVSQTLGYNPDVDDYVKAMYCGLSVWQARSVSERVSEGSIKKFVNEVDEITYNGKVAQADGRECVYVTERAVFKLTPRGLELIEIAPGVDVEKDIIAHMEFRPIIENVQPMPTEVFEG